MIEDRRRAERDRRQALRVRAVFAVKGLIKGRMQLGQAEDIGPGGMTLRCPQDAPHPPQTPILLTFALPGTRGLLGAAGVVVSDCLVGPFRRTGIRFTLLAPADEERIVRFCQVAPERYRRAASAMG
jgi:c-di-GMP-binding flagellar brake protein YcgR